MKDIKLKDCFFLVLASVISLKHYKQEIEISKKLLSYFKENQPIFSESKWQEYILASYMLHSNPIPIYGRLEFINTMLFSEQYHDSFEDPALERKKRLIDYRIYFGRKPNKYTKLAISQIVYHQYTNYVEQMESALLEDGFIPSAKQLFLQ